MGSSTHGGGLGGERGGDYGDGTRGDGYSGNPRGDNPEGGGDRKPRKRRRLPPEMLALELADGRLVGDVVGEFGAGVFAGSGLRLADGRLVEDVFRPFGLGGFGGLGGLGRLGGFKNNKDARAQFAVQQRMRKERLAALSRLGFGKTVRTGPRGVAANAPLARDSLDSG